MGAPAAYLTGRLKPGKPIVGEALGLVLICGGLALWLEVSFLIAPMVMGATIANLAKHHEYAFHKIENIEAPLMLIFFVLAGASLEIELVKELGLIGVAYVITRALGKYLGAWVGGRCGRASVAARRWTGIALLPQAGVAIGMALVASTQFPDYRKTILTIVISSTVLFELIGPVCTRLALRKAEACETASV
jgi:Kef-type K+ transport system membrane component KefB